MNRIDISNIQYDDIKTDLKNYLKTKPEFTDWEFEGSNISYLLDMMTYATYYTNSYNAFSLNESFLDTANLRSSVISHGSVHGYVPSSSKGAEMKINFAIDQTRIAADGLSAPDYVTLKKGTLFSIKIADNSFLFSNSQNYVIYRDGTTSFVYDGIILREGIRTDINTYFNISETIELPVRSDTSTIKLKVDGEEWVHAVNGVNLTSDSNAYYLKENSRGNFEVYFGNGIVSRKPQATSRIDVSLLVCNETKSNAGAAGVDISFAGTILVDNIDYTDYVDITITQVPVGGSEKESIESIREGIIVKSITQDNSITVNDFPSVIRSKFSEYVADATSWDLHDLPNSTTADLGVVNVSIKPTHYRDVPLLTQFEQTTIAKELTKNSMISGIELNIVDPDYIGINHSLDIYYKTINLETTLSDLRTIIKNNIRSLYDTDIIAFNTYLPISRIQSVVDGSETSIVSSSVTVTAEMYAEVEKNTSLAYAGKFGAPIVSGSVEITSRGITDDGAGILQQNGTGVGTVDYATGSITFALDTADNLIDEKIAIKFTPVNSFVNVSFNQLLIDTDVINYNFIEA